MATSAHTAAPSNNFQLNDELVELVYNDPRHRSLVIDITELELWRTKRMALPASKHGLETICGASCEIGAQ